MIRINLIGKKRRQKLRPIHIELIMFAAALIVVLVGAYLVNVNFDARIAFLEEEIKVKQNDLKNLRRVKRQVDDFQKKQQELQKKIDLVKNLKQGQRGYYQLLTKIEKSLPADIWLSGFLYDNGQVTLSGSSLHVASINEFIMNLYNTEMFTNLDINVVRKRNQDNLEINDFDLVASVRFDGK